MSYADELVSEYLKEAKKYLNRGAHYREAKNFDQALKEYAKSLTNFLAVLSQVERSETTGMGSSYIPFYEVEITVPILITQSTLYQGIFLCFVVLNELQKASYFLKYFKRVRDAFSSIESELDTDQIQTYQRMVEEYKNMQTLLSSAKNRKKEIYEKNNISASQQEILNSVDKYAELFADLKNELSQIELLYVSSLRKENEYLPSPAIKSGGSCFIATAAYADENHRDVQIFRKFRDSTLLTNRLGSLLVNVYYMISPYLARFITSSPRLQKFIRYHLGQLANWMRKKM